MTELEQLFRQTFEDERFSSSERKALGKILEQKGLSSHETHVLRSKIFEIAREELMRSDAQKVIDWLETATKLLVPRSVNRVENHIFFSPGEDCLNAIVNRIQSATRSLDICVFTISDDRISREIGFCHTRRVKVRILTDNEKLYDAGSDIDRLARQGISVKVDMTENHMHHKFALIDEKVLITGSYNWTRSAQLYNQENILVTNEARSVEIYAREFDRLWERMRAYG